MSRAQACVTREPDWKDSCRSILSALPCVQGEPNAEFVSREDGKVYLELLREVKAGDEITADYGDNFVRKWERTWRSSTKRARR